MTEETKRIREVIRKNLIRLRTENRLTQTEIGKIVDKTKHGVASWEQGLSLPDPAVLFQLSKFYGVPMEEFYKGTEE